MSDLKSNWIPASQVTEPGWYWRRLKTGIRAPVIFRIEWDNKSGALGVHIPAFGSCEPLADYENDWKFQRVPDPLS